MKTIIFSLTLLLGTLNFTIAQDFYLPVSTMSSDALIAYYQADRYGSNAWTGKAKELLDKAIAIDSDFFMAYALHIYYETNEQKRADLIKKALAIDVKKLSKAENIVREQFEIWQRDPKAKIGNNMKALMAAYPQTPQAYQWASLHAAYTDGNVEESIKYAQKLIAMVPDFAPVHNTLGYMYMDKKQMDKAKTSLAKYIELAPDEANAYDSMAEYYFVNNEYVKSYDYYRKAEEMGMASAKTRAEKARTAYNNSPNYFQLRPEVEKAYGYSHAVKIGNIIKVSGAVSMDDAGKPTAVGDMEQQMKNCYADLEKILAHYNCTFDDVVMENVMTTDMAKFLSVAGYRNGIYNNRFPTGSWMEVKGLALPEFMIEIELEVHTSN